MGNELEQFDVNSIRIVDSNSFLEVNSIKKRNRLELPIDIQIEDLLKQFDEAIAPTESSILFDYPIEFDEIVYKKDKPNEIESYKISDEFNNYIKFSTDSNLILKYEIFLENDSEKMKLSHIWGFSYKLDCCEEVLLVNENSLGSIKYSLTNKMVTTPWNPRSIKTPKVAFAKKQDKEKMIVVLKKAIQKIYEIIANNQSSLKDKKAVERTRKEDI